MKFESNENPPGLSSTKAEKKPLSSLHRDDAPYASHYCEENVYKLMETLNESYELPPGTHLYAVFISNSCKETPIWMQRLCPNGNIEEPVVWDYHVILLLMSTSDPSLQLVYDYDSLLPYPCEASTYISMSFQPQFRLPERYQQKFRIINGQEYLSHFSSDRSHMASADVPPPSWSVICGPNAVSAMTLPDLWSMEPDGRVVGKVMNCHDLQTFVAIKDENPL